jgi:hypothetical protein
MYLDPGAGSIILQVILAAVLGVGIFTRIFWKKIKSILGIKEKEETGEEEKE